MVVPVTMTAVMLSDFGGPEVLRTERAPVPAPGPGEVLVRVRAVSVGRTLDIATRAGRLPFARVVRPPQILGADHVGEVAALGAGVAGIALGARVAVFPVFSCGRCAGCLAGREESCGRLELLGVHRAGAYAQYCVVPAAGVHPVPDDVSDRQACALALNGAVAHRQLMVADIGAGDWILVPAAAGALGSAVVAMAVHRGARVIAGTRHPWKHQRLREIGAELVTDPAEPDFASAVAAATDGSGVRAVIDNVADPRLWQQLAGILAPGGTVVCSGALTDGRVEIDLRQLYLRSQSIRAVRTARPSDAMALWKDAASGLRVPLDATRFTLAQIADAHLHVESDRSFGRVVVAVG